ncbi:hypothetical protein F1D05_00895 [Kribbella qitaiheensis]|uniref:Uncharacterized protein n=1 Tax=Kribbella qitaiheensis TaxID=1544730 RepID=A0A7G6WRV2_9ACTN|nr:hypothetical protein [Kribbella qitaiheensis]QNE16717.1 hypothetical protein F1D05_00895 [Kribbella qitaiheensis]
MPRFSTALADPRIAASLARLQHEDYDVAPVLLDGATGTWAHYGLGGRAVGPIGLAFENSEEMARSRVVFGR